MSNAVITAWSFSLMLMFGVPIWLALWFKQRYELTWRPFVIGAMVYAIFQMLTRAPAVAVLGQAMGPQLQGDQQALIGYFIFLGVTAGLFESVGRWVGYRVWFRNELPYDWAHGVAMGIGHGGIESIAMVGLSSAASLYTGLTLTRQTPAEVMAAYPESTHAQMLAAREQILALTWPEALAGGVERVLTMAVHIALSLIVLLAFTRRQPGYLWLAVLVHAVMDVGILLLGNIVGWSTWAVEGYLALFAAASVWLILRLQGEEQSEPLSATEAL